MILALSRFKVANGLEDSVARAFVNRPRLLEYNIGLNAVLAHKKQIEVTLQIEGALPTLSLDEGKIVQVLNNLISNAVKFSQPGTAVVVRAVAEGGGMQIAVRDQGPAFPKPNPASCFSPSARPASAAPRARVARGSVWPSSGKSWKGMADTSGWKA